jgi:hypothetical protein
VTHTRNANAFAGDLVEHYVELITLLVKLFDLVGTPASDEPLLLDNSVLERLETARVSAGVQKARASWVARELHRAIADKGWSNIRVDYGFTNGTSLVEGYAVKNVVGSNQLEEAIGWQLQGSQFRLAVNTSQFRGAEHRKEREKYVHRHYLDWFDFTPLKDVTGATEAVPPAPPSGWTFHGYNPAFVYRYCTAPQLTPSQIVKLGLVYLDQARKLVITDG